MDPHREEQNKTPPASAERKPKRFRIVKLEERVAPNRGGTGSNNCGTKFCSGRTCGACY